VTEPSHAKDKIIVALDVPDADAALKLVRQLAGTVGFFKVGLELFTRCGPDIIARVRDAAREVDDSPTPPGIFLDLKLHDIPNTVGRATAAAASWGVDLLTVHLSGGGAMLKAAVAEAGKGMALLGITVLTSSDEQTLREIGVSAGSVEEQVLRLARLGWESGLRGVVASPLEIEALRREHGRDLRIVTPGVRPAGAAVLGAGKPDDQRRVLTPTQAIRAGADHLVIGRPITGHADPRAAAERIVTEVAVALA
jgi:orotidine-5'-phosphate decarboxylase